MNLDQRSGLFLVFREAPYLTHELVVFHKARDHALGHHHSDGSRHIALPV